MKKRILFLCLILLMMLTGCKKTQDDIVATKVIINDIDLENIGVLVNLYQADTNDSFSCVWNHNKLETYDDTFMTAIADLVPSKAVKKVAKKIGFEQTFLEINESVYFYDKQEEYEVYIVENREKLQWKLYFLIDDEIKEVVIQNEEDLQINDYQIEKDCIYLFSKYICRVDLNDYSTEKYLEEKDCFDFYGSGELDFIYNNCFICAENESLDDDGYNGIYRLYNLETKETYKTEVCDYINKIFPYKGGYLALCSKSYTWSPCLKYFDENLNLIEEKDIDIQSEDGNIVVGLLVHQGHLIDDKLYSIMMVDASFTNEIVVIDPESAKVLYQVEVKFKNRNNYFMNGLEFYDVSKDLMSIKEFE